MQYKGRFIAKVVVAVTFTYAAAAYAETMPYSEGTPVPLGVDEQKCAETNGTFVDGKCVCVKTEPLPPGSTGEYDPSVHYCDEIGTYPLGCLTPNAACVAICEVHKSLDPTQVIEKVTSTGDTSASCSEFMNNYIDQKRREGVSTFNINCIGQECIIDFGVPTPAPSVTTPAPSYTYAPSY